MKAFDMKRFVALCFLVGYAHAVTCIDAVLMERKNVLAGYAVDDGAYLDSVYYRMDVSDGEIVFKEKLVRSGDKITASWFKKRGDEIRENTSTAFYRKSESEVDGSVESEVIVHKDQEKDTLFLNLTYYQSGKKTSDDQLKYYPHGLLLDYTDAEDGYRGVTDFYMQNDTLFQIHVGYEDGSATPDTSEYHIYVPDQTDPHKCDLWFRHDGIGSVTDIDGHDVQAGEFYKNYGFTVVENEGGFVLKRLRYHDLRIDEYYMIYSDGSTTAIGGPNHAKMRVPKARGSFDVKGRSVNKKIPYRVVF
jgi:hypothetical protein